MENTAETDPLVVLEGISRKVVSFRSILQELSEIDFAQLLCHFWKEYSKTMVI